MISNALRREDSRCAHLAFDLASGVATAMRFHVAANQHHLSPLPPAADSNPMTPSTPTPTPNIPDRSAFSVGATLGTGQREGTHRQSALVRRERHLPSRDLRNQRKSEQHRDRRPAQMLAHDSDKPTPLGAGPTPGITPHQRLRVMRFVARGCRTMGMKNEHCVRASKRLCY